MYYKHLNLRIDSVLINESVLHSVPHGSHYKLSILDLNPKFIRLIERKGLIISLIEVFKLDPLRKQWPVHVDGWEISDFPKMNFIHGNKESPMVWYKVKEGVHKEPSPTVIGTPYLNFLEDEIEEVDRGLIKYPSIIQAGVPHTVLHTGFIPRWAVSITFMKDFKFLRFDDTVEIFKEFIE